MIGIIDNVESNKKIKLLCAEVLEPRVDHREMTRSGQFYQRLLDNAGVSVVLHDAETGEWLAFNKEAHESRGYTRDEFLRLPIGGLD